jgi:hypothetical protein
MEGDVVEIGKGHGMIDTSIHTSVLGLDIY